MNKIDSYIDEIYKKFDGNNEELIGLKEEMKSHLYEEVEDLKNKGFSEEESIQKALEAFGEEKNVVKSMNTIWTKDKELALFFLKITAVTFAIGCIFMIISAFYKNSIVESGEITSEYTINQIYEKIADTYTLSKDEVEKVLNDFNVKNNDGLYYVKVSHSNNLEYEYKKDVSIEYIKNNYESKIVKNSWEIYYKKTDKQQEKDMESIAKLTDLNSKPLTSAFKEMAFSLFLVCSLLLCMAFYACMGMQVYPVFDLSFGGVALGAIFFPNHILISGISFTAVLIAVFYLSKRYFLKTKNKVRF